MRLKWRTRPEKVHTSVFVHFFGWLLRHERSRSELQAYLSDHPATADRIEHLNAYIAEHRHTGENADRQDYARMKRYLATLPARRPAPPRMWLANPAR